MIAGIADYTRPAEKLSVTQSISLMATGKQTCSLFNLKTGLALDSKCLLASKKNYAMFQCRS